MAFAIIINFTKLPHEAFRSDITNINGSNIFNELVNNHPYASIYRTITNFNSKCLTLHIGLGSDPNEVCFDDTSSGNILYILIAFPIALLLMLNIVWVMSINNHYSIPKSMMLAVIKGWKQNEINNANIYTNYLDIFIKELNDKLSPNNENNKYETWKK